MDDGGELGVFDQCHVHLFVPAGAYKEMPGGCCGVLRVVLEGSGFDADAEGFQGRWQVLC